MNFKLNLKMAGAAALTALTAWLGLGTSPMAGAQGQAALLPMPVPAGERLIRSLAPDEVVQLSLQLPYRDQAGLDVLDQRLFTPGDPLFHKFLGSKEFNDRYAPTQEQYDELAALAERSGLTVKERYSGRTLLGVEAPASTVQRLFGVRMSQLQTREGKTYSAGDRAAVVTGAFSALGVSVAGLYQRPLRSHAIIQPLQAPAPSMRGATAEANPNAGSFGGGAYSPADVRKVYNTSSLTQTGAGQTIALYELSSTNYDNDTQHYITQFGLPARTTSSFITVVNVDSGTSDTSGAGEVTLDIDMVLAMMPSIGKILVYTAPNSGNGPIDCYQKIADDNLASVVSTSWGIDEGSAYSASNASLENTIFQKMLTQGQAVFAASGDSGAYDDGSTLSVDDPASQTNVTGVGGTTLTSSSAQVYQSETAWNNPGDTSRSPHGAGGGGGISQHVALPDYQQGIVSNAPAGEFSTSFRNVPDVSLNANPNTGYAVYFSAGEAGTGSGAGFYLGGGTSAAAPLWATFWLQINQALTAQGKPVAGFANPLIYRFAKNATSYANDFHDVNDNSTNLFYHAVNGYDTATGWGSFNGAKLFQDVVNSLSSGVPAAPTNVAVTGSSSGQVTLSWTPSAGATGYDVFISYSSGHEAQPVALAVSGGSATGGTVTGLANGHTYYFVVQATSNYGNSLNSSEVSASLVPPAAPTNVAVTPGSGQATLSWTPSPGATGYDVFISYSSGHEAQPVALAVSGGSATGGTVTGLTNGHTYYFVVQATSNYGNSLNSSEVSASLLPPTAPTNVAVTSSGSGQATLSWTPSAGATGYNVFMSYSSGHEAQPVALAVSGGSATGGTVTGLTNGHTYYFVVQATSNYGNSLSSSEVSASLLPPAAPTNVAVAGSSSGQVTLSWTPSPGATGYSVFRSTSSGHEAQPVALAVSGGSATGGTVTGLANGATYYFVVQATSNYGNSLNSSEVSASLLPPAAPTNVAVTPGSGQATLSWTPSPGATGYDVFISYSSGHEAQPVALAVSGGSATGGTVTRLTNGSTYYFVVQATSNYGNSLNSSEVSTTPH